MIHDDQWKYRSVNSATSQKIQRISEAIGAALELVDEVEAGRIVGVDRIIKTIKGAADTISERVPAGYAHASVERCLVAKHALTEVDYAATVFEGQVSANGPSTVQRPRAAHDHYVLCNLAKQALYEAKWKANLALTDHDNAAYDKGVDADE